MTRNLSIAALLRAYRARELTPLQLVEELLAARDRYDARNIWIHSPVHCHCATGTM